MAWTNHPITHWPADVRNALEAALPQCDTLHGRIKIAAGELAVNWAGHVHHSAKLAAVLVEAMLDPAMVARMQGRTRWTDLVACSWRMDSREKRVVAALAGRTDRGGPEVFDAALRRLIAAPGLAEFWTVTAPDDGSRYAVRPAGYRPDGRPEDLRLLQDRERLRTLPTGWRATAATITTLYNDSLAETVFRGPALDLKVPEAIAGLQELDEETRRDVFTLMAAYGGW